MPSLDMQNDDRERVGVLMGTAFGGAMDESQDAARTFIERGPMKVSPFYMVRLLPNMAAHHVSCYFDTQGYTSTVVVACASGTQAIGEATEVLRRGHADVMLAGGTESQFSPLALASMSVIGGFTTHNEEPEKASRPFDKNRDGIVGSEGAARGGAGNTGACSAARRAHLCRGAGLCDFGRYLARQPSRSGRHARLRAP